MKKIFIIALTFICLLAYTEKEIKEFLPEGYELAEYIETDTSMFIQVRYIENDVKYIKGYGINEELRQKPLKEIIDSIIAWTKK